MRTKFITIWQVIVRGKKDNSYIVDENYFVREQDALNYIDNHEDIWKRSGLEYVFGDVPLWLGEE